MKHISFGRVLLALVIFPFMAYEGIDRGATYGSIDESQALTMQVTSVDNANGRAIFPDYQASGTLPTGAAITVKIFKREFQQLRAGDRLEVFSVPSKAESYVTASKIEESKPFIRWGSFTFTWHFPVGVVGWIVIVLYIIFAPLNTRRG